MGIAENNTQPQTRQADLIQRGIRGERLPITIGALSGLISALVVIVVMTVILVANGVGGFTTPRVIASVLMGSNTTGLDAVSLGTLIHLATGTILGVVFALLMPPIHRVMWIVAGMIYGIAAFMASALVVLPMFTPGYRAAAATIGVLLTVHVMYGAILGLLGGTYNLYWGPRPNLESSQTTPRRIWREDI